MHFIFSYSRGSWGGVANPPVGDVGPATHITDKTGGEGSIEARTQDHPFLETSENSQL